MQNFTTQEHPRNHSTVVENPGKTIADLREKQRNRNLMSGVVISAMALAVVVTGSLLGSTVAHNQQLKGQLGELTTQNQTLNQQLSEMATANETPTVDTLDPANYYNRSVTQITDRTAVAPNQTTGLTRTTNPDRAIVEDTDEQRQATNTTLRNTEPTANPTVMAEPTPTNEVTSEPTNRPTLYTNRHRATPPEDDRPTPMPRIPSARHARVW